MRRGSRRPAFFSCTESWRRGGDSNPRGCDPYTISSRAVSTAHAPLQRSDYTEKGTDWVNCFGRGRGECPWGCTRRNLKYYLEENGLIMNRTPTTYATTTHTNMNRVSPELFRIDTQSFRIGMLITKKLSPRRLPCSSSQRSSFHSTYLRMDSAASAIFRSPAEASTYAIT